MCRSQEQYYSPISEEIQRFDIWLRCWRKAKKRMIGVCVSKEDRFRVLLPGTVGSWLFLFSWAEGSKLFESLMNYADDCFLSLSFFPCAGTTWNHTTEIFELLRRIYVSHFFTSFDWFDRNLIWTFFFSWKLLQFSFVLHNRLRDTVAHAHTHLSYLFLSFLSFLSFFLLFYGPLSLSFSFSFPSATSRWFLCDVRNLHLSS